MEIVFDHEKLDVYRVALEFIQWSRPLIKSLKGDDRSSRDQLIRSSQSMPRNIAEGNGKRSKKDRGRYFEIALSSALESAATLDILVVCGAVTPAKAREGKRLLHRVVSMLTKMLPAR